MKHEMKREWKAIGKYAELCIDGIPQGYSEYCGSHDVAKDVAERLNEEDAE